MASSRLGEILEDRPVVAPKVRIGHDDVGFNTR